MNTHILPEKAFRAQALAEVKQDYPRWCSNNAQRLECAIQILRYGMTDLGDGRYQIRDCQVPCRTQIVDKKHEVCDCCECVAYLEMFSKPCHCPHRIAVYLLLRARQLEREHHHWLEQFNRTMQSRQPEDFAALAALEA